MDMFNLPSYTKGKTFAEASKAIAKQFEGRTDKESLDTLNDLQSRLQSAQEFIKSKSEPQAPTGQPTGQDAGQAMAYGGDTNDHFLGGIMKSIGGMFGGGAAGAAGDVAGEAAGGALSGGIPGLGALQKAPEAISHFKDGNAAKGIMSAASGVASMIPGVGSIASPILDLAGGFIGNGDAKKEAQRIEVGDTASQHKQFNNRYANGGFMDNTDPNELIKMLQSNIEPSGVVPLQTEGPQGGPILNQAGREIQQNVGAGLKPYGVTGMRGLPATSVNSGIEAQGVVPLGESAESQLQASAAKGLEGLLPVGQDSGQNEEGSGYDPSQLLRYAPAVTDAYQLATLEKPEDVSRDRLGNRYQEQQVDERQLQKTVQEGINNQRDAILGSSGGSGSTARANLLGLSLQGTKALSSAMAQAGEQNRQDKRTGQQFNLGVDQTNLQQSNAAKLATEQNQGAYDAQKSQLISQLGSNLGEIGKEQLFKKYPELMGMDFDSLGKYLKTKKGKKK